MKKKLIINFSILFIIVVIASIFIGGYFDDKNNSNNLVNSDAQVVLSLEDDIKDNAVWCGTMNLVWNDLKDEFVKQNIIFNPQPNEVDNLNKSTFNVNYLSEDDYYKKWGINTLELKKEIEKAIDEKFNEKSDILDDFEWNGEGYFFYSILLKKFEFEYKFDVIEGKKFNGKSAKFFGIGKDSKEELRSQVEVLNYLDEGHYAVMLHTKGKDNLILTKGLEGKNFLEMYNNIKVESKYNSGFNYDDTLEVPMLNFSIKENFEVLKGKPFYNYKNEEYVITNAIQTIKFELNEAGGKLKSEAGIGIKETAMEPKPSRHFVFDSDFTLFLIEEDKDLPYFAVKIDNITKFQ